jgi:hypothetical protein
LKTAVNVTVPSKSKKQKKNLFFVDILEATEKKEQDSDPYQNVTDPQHCLGTHEKNKFLNIELSRY